MIEKMTDKFDLPKAFHINGKQDVVTHAECVNWLKRFLTCVDREVTVSITETISDYTNSQSGYFHVCCRILGRELGITEGDCKRLIKKELWDTDVIQIGQTSIEVYKSMEKGKVNKLDYSEAIECVLRLAAEVNVYLPEARDR
jgi:hypothetical protein